MEKQLVLCVSSQVQKYYFEKEFKEMPYGFRQELLASMIKIAQRAKATIMLGFYNNGDIYIKEHHEEGVIFDEIGLALEIKAFQSEKKELIKMLKKWYMLYYMAEGKIVRKILVMQNQGLEKEEIIEKMVSWAGEEKQEFVEMLLEG
ncbi:MAG: hypothetical protein ATN36_03080 [Epulopiscium sp. Nele67-Bin005]|nr:MAG: hypothetical protein ATN36_03080 [Epulopiscium sp. Nele67-Bin005]